MSAPLRMGKSNPKSAYDGGCAALGAERMRASMDFSGFKQSVTGKSPPAGLSEAVQALWWDAKGDWEKAHNCAQAQDDEIGAWVHAYLHRKEGDQSNAGYWYRRAKKTPASTTLDEEWSLIARSLLAKTP